MANPTKDTIYIDIDDEITTIIDKVQASPHKIVALVLPKRAVTLQSIVNMRLLKRTGQELDKRLVLITSEASLLPLAGIVGLYTAKTLQSKPVIPSPPDTASAAAETVVEDDGSKAERSSSPKSVTRAVEPEIDETKSVGELAGMPPEPEVQMAGMDPEETIDVDNTGDEAVVAAAGEGEVTKKSKSSKIKIPNFESFRLRLFLAGLLLVLLIVGWVFAFKVLPKAQVVVKTDNTTVNSTIDFAAQTGVKAVDTKQALVPAQTKDVKKTDSVKVNATGQKNEGTNSTGSVTATNCTDTAVTLPQGTLFTNNGYSFTTDAAITVPNSDFFSDGRCKANGKASITVTATNGGGAYNLNAGRSYTSNFASTLTGVGSAMTGGTDKIVTVISQQDVDTAKAGLVDKSKDAAVSDLNKAIVAAKLIPLGETITGADPVVTTTPNVGDESSDVTVTSVTDYTMLAIKSDDIDKLISVNAAKQINLTKQPIADYGLAKATFHMTSKRSGTDQSITMQTTVVAGTKIDANALKKQIVGQKRADVVKTVEQNPGVKDVTVNYSPFWVAQIPKNPTKTTIVFEQTNSNGK